MDLIGNLITPEKAHRGRHRGASTDSTLKINIDTANPDGKFCEGIKYTDAVHVTVKCFDNIRIMIVFRIFFLHAIKFQCNVVYE